MSRLLLFSSGALLLTAIIFSLPSTPSPLPVDLASLDFSRVSITGGSSAFGTITLSRAAPADGIVISLYSSNRFVASVPASVTILGGKSVGSFTVATNPVPAQTPVTISISYSNSSKATTLTLMPRPSGPPQSGGTTYYVAPAGSDANPGTQARPFATIQKAADIVMPGDTVIVEDGVYTRTTSTCAGVVCISRGGTSGNWIVFKAKNKWRAKVDGQNGSVAEGFTFRNGVGYIRVEGFEVFGMANASGSASGFDVYAGGHDIQIAGNHIHTIGKVCTDTSNGQVGVFIQQNNVTVEGNLIHDIGRFAPGENGCNPSTRYYQGLDHGIYINGNSPDPGKTGNGAMVCNNIFYNNHRGWSVQIYPGTLTNITVVNNTFATPSPYKNGQLVVYKVKLSDSRIENNIFYQPRNAAITVGGGPTFANVSVRNNITTAGAIADLMLSGMTSGNNWTSTDPMLTSAERGDFHVQAGSPAIDMGLPMPEVINDFDGRKRPQGAGYDIGAYESPSGAAVPKITKVEVDGKKLYVYGEEFKQGAVVILNGEDQTTSNQGDFSHQLKCKKAGKKVSPGSTVILKVRNPDGIESAPFHLRGS